MLIWLSRQSTSLVRMRSPVRIRVLAPGSVPLHHQPDLYIGLICFARFTLIFKSEQSVISMLKITPRLLQSLSGALLRRLSAVELFTPTERRICSRRQRRGASALGYIHITVIGRVPLHAIRVLRYFYLYVCSRDKNSIKIVYVHRLCSASSQYLYPRRSALRHAAQPSVPHTPQRPTQFRTTTPQKR